MNKLFSITFYFSISLVLCSCKTVQSIDGNYYLSQKNKRPPYYIMLLNLESDGSFEYKEGTVSKLIKSSGKWEIINKNQILLESYISDIDNIDISVSEVHNNENTEKLFILSNFSLHYSDTADWGIFINGIKYPIKSDSIYIPKDIDITSFYINGYKDYSAMRPSPSQENIKTIIHKVKNESANVFYVSFPILVNSDIFHYRTINDTVKIGHNKLIWKSKKRKLKKES